VEFGYAPSRTQPVDPTAQIQAQSLALRQAVMDSLKARSPRAISSPNVPLIPP